MARAPGLHGYCRLCGPYKGDPRWHECAARPATTPPATTAQDEKEQR